MIRAAIAAAAAAVAAGAFAAQPVAFVADVRGSATIEGDGKVAFLAQVEPGTRLFLGTGARVAITYAGSGSEFTAVGPGEFLVSTAELRAEKGAVPERREVTPLRGTAALADASRLATASLRMRGGAVVEAQEGAGTTTLEYPVDTKVATLEPLLRWRAGGQARQAKVSLRDESGNEVWSAPAIEASIRPSVKLSAATRYTWTVMTPRGLLGEGRFETLAEEPLATVRKSAASAHSFSERVMHALLLQDLGAVQDARAAWSDLARERPDLPELARLTSTGGRSRTP